MEALRSGFARVQWPGRFQKIGGQLVVDGAHNPAAASALVETWREAYPGEKASLVFGALQDKDAAEVLRRLAPITGRLTLVPVQSPRTLGLNDLRLIAEAVFGLDGEADRIGIFEARDVASALSGEAGEFRRLVTGSLYLVGEVLALEAGVAQEKSAQ
jgi:dihydrofolate synthase/folylpolyglutamate synthase